MPRTYTSLILALATLAATACADEPLRPTRSEPEPEHVIARTVNGRAVQVRYDGRTATLTVDGRTTMRVRYDGDRRHVTAYLADGRVFERTYTRRELARAARQLPRPGPRPSLDEYDGTTAVTSDSEDGFIKCSKEWVAFAGAALVAVVTCDATGPSPACASAVAAAAVALDAVITCENKNKPPTI